MRNSILNIEYSVDPQKREFSQQYDHPRTVKVKGGKLEIYHAAPNEEGRTDNSPILLGHGHPANPTGMKENVYQLCSRGKEVFFPYTPDGIEISEDIQKSESEIVKGQAEIELKKASAFVKSIDEEKLQNINGVAFSEGALHVIIAALMRTDKFKNIVLISSSGIMGKTSIFKFILGGVRHALQKRKKGLETDEREAPDHTESPKRITDLKSKLAIPQSDILDALVYLRNQGIGIKIIHTRNDTIYPLENVQKMLQEKGLMDLLKVVEGTHTAFSSNPERFGQLTVDALNDLDKNRKETK